MPNDFYFDLHIHPIIKSFYSDHPKPTKTIWENIDHHKASKPIAKIAEKNAMHVASHSQCNFKRLLEGKTRAVSVSLTPIEKGFLKHRNLPKVISSTKARREIFSLVSGMSYNSVVNADTTDNYFKELNDEYKYLVNGQGKTKDGEYYIGNNYTELTDIVKNKDSIGVVMSIEGGHSLYDEKMLGGELTNSELRKQLLKNIQEVKNWEHPPLFMTMAHHFWNGMVGHSKSIMGATSNFVNQNRGLDLGINGTGAVAMRELLSSDNGKRVIIDTKHMSVKARKEYYKFIKSFNRIARKDDIPVIQSHASPNGFKTIGGSLRRKDSKKKLKDGYLHNLSINISDEEFKIIHKSGGLVGLILNKERLYGGKFSASVEKLSNQQEIKDAHTKIIWDNFMQPVKALNTKTAWDVFCIGSDWDGAITHLDEYDTAAKMPNLYNDLVEYLDKYKYEKKYWFGYKPEELVEKIMKTNGMDFLQKHFV
jgi:microsomal dipeptidase-like Zn-dependent dipeptidase